MVLCIGFDGHAGSITYKTKNDDGELIDGDTIPSTREALVELARRHPGATVVMEASSVSEWMHDALVEEGLSVVVSHPVSIRRVLGKKNDEVDAGFLADAYRLGVLPRSYVPSSKYRELRSLVRRRAFMTKEQTRVKNRVRAILLRTGERRAENIFAAKRRAEIERIDEEIPMLLALLDAISEQTKRLDEQIRLAALKNEDARNLMTVPGFGAYTALALVAEAGEIARFPSSGSFAACFGLVPSETQSGEHLARGHITKRGNPHIRQLLNQAAWAHVRTCPGSSLTRAHNRVWKKAGRKRAIAATSRRLAVIAYTLLKEQRGFTLNG